MSHLLLAASIVVTRILSLLYFYFLRKIEFFSSFGTDSIHHYHLSLLVPIVYYASFLFPNIKKYLPTLLVVALGIIIEEHIVLVYEIISPLGYDVPYYYLSAPDTFVVMLIAGGVMSWPGIKKYFFVHHSQQENQK